MVSYEQFLLLCVCKLAESVYDRCCWSAYCVDSGVNVWKKELVDGSVAVAVVREKIIPVLAVPHSV
jgi:hypothetical protein